MTASASGGYETACAVKTDGTVWCWGSNRGGHLGDGTTRVEIEHAGWERLGAEGETWRDRNHGGWATLLPHFIEQAARRGEAPR